MKRRIHIASRFASLPACALLSLLGSACSDGGFSQADDVEQVGSSTQQLTAPANAAGFSDGHEKSDLRGWSVVGSRRWVEKGGVLTTLSPGSTATTGGSNTGFILSDYPSADDGTFEAVLKADPWGGDAGGMVLRWSSPNAFYYFTVKPADEWGSKLVFHVNSLTDAGTVVAQKFKIGSTFNLKVVAHGDTFDVYLDGVLRATVKDAKNKYGRVGYAYTNSWENLFSAQESQWVDAPGSTPSSPVDPQAGRAELKVHVRDEAYGSSNTLSPKIYVENTGEVTAHDFTVYYLFKAEAGKVPVLEDWWTPESTPTLVSLGDGEYAIEYSFAGLDLAPGESTPSSSGNIVGIHYTDWSPIDKTNDFSNPSGPEWQVSTKLPVEGAFKRGTNFAGTGDEVIKLVGGSLPKMATNMKRLKLKRLRCIDTTDDDDSVPWGYDNVALNVILDGQDVKTIDAGSMDEDGSVDTSTPKNYYFDGNGGHDNEFLEFRASAKISIFDYESVSFDAFRLRLIDWDTTDFIGSNVLDLTAGSHTVRFNRDGKYDLYYDVEDFETEATFATLADYQWQKFKDSTATGVWPKIDKSKLITDLRARLDPRADGLPGAADVDQGQLGYCGPASATYWLIKNKPLRYVTYARQMYETGVYHGAQHDYAASSALRSCEIPTNQGISNAADWLVMSSLSDNFAYPGNAALFRPDERIHPDANGFPESYRFHHDIKDTGNREMAYWFKDVLGYNYVDDDSTFIGGEYTLLKKARDVVERGGAAVLGVNNDALQDNTVAWSPNHYIAFLGELEHTGGDWYRWDSGSYKFKYWNWAEEVHVNITEDQMENSIWGGTMSR